MQPKVPSEGTTSPENVLFPGKGVLSPKTTDGFNKNSLDYLER